MYDHTVESPPTHHSNFHFYRKRIGSQVSHNQESLDSILSSHSHAALNDIVLQCDIEGTEWEVFAGVSQNTLAHFSQIIIGSL